MKHRRLLLSALAAGALASAVQAGATRYPRLEGTVGPGFTITLRDSHAKRVTNAKAGTYTFVVRDRASSHDFTLEQVSGGAFEQVLTGDGLTGTRTVTVKLTPGKWRYFCVAHEPAMFGFFMVR
jgi:hypothetical protein